MDTDHKTKLRQLLGQHIQYTPQDTRWRVVPVVMGVLSVATIVHFSITMSSLSIPFSTFKYWAIICACFPVAAFLIVPIFHFFYLFRDCIVTLYISVMIAGCLMTLIAPIVAGAGAVSVVGPAVMLVVTGVFLFFTRHKIRLAGLTVRISLDVLRQSIGKIFKKLLLPLVVLMIFYGFTVFMMIGEFFLRDYKKNIGQSNTVEVIMAFVSLICAFFVESMLEATMFLFGASFFYHTFSLRTHREELGEGSDMKIERFAATAAYERVFRYSLGSCCLAALVLVIVRMAESKSEDKKNESGVGAALLGGLLGLLAYILRFLTHQGLIYVSIYGKSLAQSGKMAIESFKSAGLNKFFNFTFVVNFLQLISLILGLIFGFLTYLIVYLIDKGKTNHLTFLEYFVPILAVVIIFMSGASVISNIVGAAGQSVISLYVEDPEKLKVAVGERRFEKISTLLGKGII